jgi:F-type H+-transporting ATPase subunit b
MNINWTLGSQIVSFFLFVWFCKAFVWPPLMRAIETRQKQVADGLAAAEKARVELQSASKRAEEELAAARARAQDIVAQAEKRAQAMIEDAKNAAKAEGDREKAAAKAEIDQEATRARESLREQVAALAVAGAEKILRREVNAQTHADLLSQLKREL